MKDDAGYFAARTTAINELYASRHARKLLVMHDGFHVIVRK